MKTVLTKPREVLENRRRTVQMMIAAARSRLAESNIPTSDLIELGWLLVALEDRAHKLDETIYKRFQHRPKEKRKKSEPSSAGVFV